jgi:uncharacterized membrane protein (Fun14 family)
VNANQDNDNQKPNPRLLIIDTIIPEGNRKMSGIESSIMPFVSTIGFGGIAGFLVGFAFKRIMKILAVIAGVFFCCSFIFGVSAYNKYKLG